MNCHGADWITAMEPVQLAGMVRREEGEEPLLRSPEQIAALRIDPTKLESSVHAAIRCIDCHTDAAQIPHPQRLQEVGCNTCHGEVGEAIAGGMHNPARPDLAGRAPNCADCHGEPHAIHGISRQRSFEQASQQTNACLACHDQEQNGSNHGASYRDNIHGQALFKKGLSISATCADCHGAHRILPAADPQSPVHSSHAPETCGKCHSGIKDVYLTSIHGQKLAEGNEHVAACTTCHASHGIHAVDSEFHTLIVQECSHCHEGLGKSYLQSYHGKATILGNSHTAVCSSCHGAHDILPASDPKSRINEANLVQTCGQCHPDANANFVQYIPHVDMHDRARFPQVFYTWLFMTTMLLGVLAVFLPHGLLWFQRSLVDRIRHPEGFHRLPAGERYVRRFHWVHRVTHALIIISFMGLVITGFPLKYAYAGWAQKMAGLFGGSEGLGLLHRGFAIVTFAYAAVHVVFLIWFFLKKCPRPLMRYIIGPESLLFSLRDAKEFVAMIKWFLWLGPRPRFGRWTYFEKFDYWGEIWGVFLIGGTGLILWFPTLFTRWLPGWVLNCAMVIHSIEALLAASVIFLVHFFNTHVRPEKFPVDMVMLTGQMSETEMKEERPAEYDALVATGKLEERIVPAASLRLRLIGGALGIMAFLLGTFLILLALRTEIGQLFAGN